MKNYISGPYKLSPHNSSIIRDVEGNYLCGISAEYRTKAQVEATAQLLATAPELLNALEYIVAVHEGFDESDFLDDAKLVIKKAKGEI